MEVLIKKWFDAVEYVPVKPTYAIGIHDKERMYDPFKLKDSGLYVAVEYVFDDRTPEFGTGIVFDEGLARQVLTGFKEMGLDKETLLVYCGRGRNRSPAVAIALNEIFGLGYDTAELKEKYSEANWFVYKTLVKTAKKVNLDIGQQP